MVEINSAYFKTLSEEREYQVILPEDYDGEKRFPVLYLIHGMDQNYLSWTRFTFLEVIAKKFPYIIAISNGDDNWYKEFKEGFDRIRNYHFEFIDHIDNKYKTIRKKEARGICGISLGGYQAMFLGITKPDYFVGISALSGILNLNNHLSADPLCFNQNQNLNKEYWSEYNPVIIAYKLKDFDMQIMFDTGTEDDTCLCDANNFHQALVEFQILHIFNQYPGKHEWHYWDEHLEEHLDFHLENFKRGKNNYGKVY